MANNNIVRKGIILIVKESQIATCLARLDSIVYTLYPILQEISVRVGCTYVKQSKKSKSNISTETIKYFFRGRFTLW